MLKFFIDTNSELWFSKVDQMDVGVINMPYCLDSELLNADLGRNEDYKNFFEQVQKGVQPTTCGLNKDNYIEYFEPILSAGDDIIYVTFSHKLSNTFEYMNQAINELKEKYPERTITTVDTKQISIGEAIVIEEAYKLYKEGASADQIVEFVEQFRVKIGTYFGVESLMYLKKGGRVSGTTAVLGTLLNIKPILKINEEGAIVKLQTAKGMKGVVKTLFDIFVKEEDNAKDYPLYVVHAMRQDLAEELKKLIEDYLGESGVVQVQPVGPTIGTHCGVGTIGISFHKK